MKRFLFVILALVMTIALIPAAFAEGEASDAGITVEYSFAGTYGDDPRVAINYGSTNGRFRYEGTNSVKTSFGYNGGLAYFDIRDGNYVAFRIRVPVAGEYNIKFDARDTGYCNKLTTDMYVLPGNTADIAASLTTESSLIADICKVSGTYSYSAKKELVAGEYIVAFKRTGFADGGTVTEHVFRPKLLTLTSGEGTGKALIYADVNVEDEDAVLDAGNNETIEITLSNVFMSDGAAATEDETADITYVSTDETVASVSGTTVTAKKVGTTTIRAMSGDYVLGEKEIEVTNSKLSGVKVEYSFDFGNDETSSDASGRIEYTKSNATYSKTQGKIMFEAMYNTNSSDTLNSNATVRCYDGYVQFNTRNNYYTVFRINVPVSGIYNVGLNLADAHASSTKGSSIVDVHILRTPATLTFSGLTEESRVLSDVGATAETAYSNTDGVELSAGEYYLVFKRKSEYRAGTVYKDDGATINSDNQHYTWLKDFTLDGGTGTAPIWANMSVEKSELSVDETTALTSTVYMSDGSAATDTTDITYESTNTGVATISGTTVTATGAGTATIQAKNGNYVLGEVDVTVTAPAAEPEAAPETVSYGQYDNVNGKVSVKETTPGTELTFTAEDIAGYTFRYWVLGSAATGRYYSSEKSVTVTPYANIALTAIYTQNSDVKVVDLYNYNGEFLKTITALSDLADVQPAMIGHTFANKWLLADETELTADTTLTETVTQAVAQYTKNTGYEAENINTDSTYGWTRNGKLVTYDEDYTFLTWLNSVGTIAKNEEEVTDRIPIAVLESKDDAYMLEYDKGAYEIVEVGILFGTTADPEVDSAYSKAKVKDIKAHGQFTASPMDSETYARGYVIYKDGDDYKVIYAD